jgi:HNH endonuclease
VSFASDIVINFPTHLLKPKAKGGTDRISNLCLACEKCNLKKGTQDIEKFLDKKPELLKKILSQAKRPLKDASAVNSTRWALFNALKQIGLPVTTASGGLTKFNRTRNSAYYLSDRPFQKSSMSCAIRSMAGSWV